MPIRNFGLLLTTILIAGTIGCAPSTTQKQEEDNGDVHVLKLIPLQDTFHIDNRWYQLMDDQENKIHLVSEIDTVLLCNKQGIHAAGIVAEDLNDDGTQDIRIPFISNTPGQEEVHLYDRYTGRFVKLENTEHLFAIQRLEGVPLYYSYNRAGCSDYNWVSHLFYIESNSAHVLGTMNGRQCPSEAFPAVLTFRTSDTGGKTMVDSLPGDTSLDFFSKKADYIAQYWQANYERFLKYQ